MIGRLRLLALPDLRDGLRSRRQLLVRSLMPVALLVALGGVTVAVGPGGASAGVEPLVVAVEGDFAGASDTLDDLSSDDMSFVPTEDAGLAVVGSADVGLRVPEGLDRRMASAEPTRVEVVELAIDESSRAATIQIRNAAAGAHLQQVLASDPALVSLFDFVLISTDRTEEGSFALLAELVPALVCLQAAVLVGGAANRVLGRRGGGLLAVQLALPVRRWELAAGKALAELGVGVVASSLVLVPAWVAGIVVAASGGGLGAGLAAAVMIPAVVVLLSGLATALGVTVAFRARSQEHVTLASGAALVVAALVATFVAVGGTGRPLLLSLVPVAGPVSELRMLLLGSPRFGALVVSLLVTTLAGWLAVRAAGRSLDAERLVGRT